MLTKAVLKQIEANAACEHKELKDLADYLAMYALHAKDHVSYQLFIQTAVEWYIIYGDAIKSLAFLSQVRGHMTQIELHTSIKPLGIVEITSLRDGGWEARPFVDDNLSIDLVRAAHTNMKLNKVDLYRVVSVMNEAGKAADGPTAWFSALALQYEDYSSALSGLSYWTNMYCSYKYPLERLGLQRVVRQRRKFNYLYVPQYDARYAGLSLNDSIKGIEFLATSVVSNMFFGATPLCTGQHPAGAETAATFHATTAHVVLALYNAAEGVAVGWFHRGDDHVAMLKTRNQVGKVVHYATPMMEDNLDDFDLYVAPSTMVRVNESYGKYTYPLGPDPEKQMDQIIGKVDSETGREMMQLQDCWVSYTFVQKVPVLKYSEADPTTIEEVIDPETNKVLMEEQICWMGRTGSFRQPIIPPHILDNRCKKEYSTHQPLHPSTLINLIPLQLY
jgi:hypothetical protein